MGKAFEKQKKTIEDQGKRQVKAIQNNKMELANINDDCKNKVLLSKEEKFLKIFTKKDLIK